MAKYSYELKKKIVEEYLCGKTSYQALAMKCRNREVTVSGYGLADYKNYGDEGLMRSRNNRAYSVEFKLGAITYAMKRANAATDNLPSNSV